ncbi:MAG TPA: hypothetical protein VEX67_10415 [Solirubrobacteraceae bacterium]|nr:hypothetical protein [Solirubrobacteraceae bacterium]
MALNQAFASTPAILSADGQLSLEGFSDPVFVSTGEGAELHEGTLISRTVAVEQDGRIFPGTASLGSSKSWSASVTAEELHEGSAAATAFEVYALAGSEPPLTATFSWTQDIEIEPG